MSTPPHTEHLSSPVHQRRPQLAVARTMGTTAFASVAVLAANLLGGVLIARTLSASGKGAVTAILSWAQLVAWVCALGFPAAMTYLQSRRPEIGPRIVGTSLVASGLFGLFGFVGGELLVWFVFADQPADIRLLAQIFMLTVFLGVMLDMTLAIIAGDHLFSVLNLLRVLRPLTYVALVGLLWVLLDLTVGSALIAAVGAQVFTLGWGLNQVRRRIGIGRPSKAILRDNIGYGLKLQGGTLAGLANTRLDILIMPIYLSTTAIGVYSIAVSVSSMVLSLIGSLSLVVFPVAARAGIEQAPAFVARALRLTLILAMGFSAFLFVSAPWLVRWIYGDEFTAGVTALRILLVGYVCVSGSSIVVAGLKAVNMPFAASASQLAAIPVTIVGLLFFLERYGIEGAAVVSTVAYALAFGVGLAILARSVNLPIGDLLSVRAARRDLVDFGSRMRARLLPGAKQPSAG